MVAAEIHRVGVGPTALHDLTVVGHVLAQTERWAEARELFSHMGNQAHEYPWCYPRVHDSMVVKDYPALVAAGAAPRER